MSQSPNNSIDIPLLGEGMEDLLIRTSPAVRAIDFAMKPRPEVKGKDTRSTWGKFSDWIFDGVLPDEQTNFYGEGMSEAESLALQEKAALKSRGGKPFIDKKAGSAERLAADLLVGFADEGKISDQGDPAELVADDIMLEMARATIADPEAADDERSQAIDTIGERAIRQMMLKQDAEGGLASVSDANGLTKRVVELWADGQDEESIGAELREGGWDYSQADRKIFDRLQQEVEILLDQGEFGRAKALTFARLNLMKNGGAADVNMNEYDTMLDEQLRADSSDMTRREAFSIATADGFLSTIRGIGRLTGMGYTTPKDKDILEKMVAASYEEHPVSSLAGSFAGGFADPVFFAISMGAAKAPITAAQRLRYVDDLVIRGTPKALATEMGAKATLETIATNRLTKHYLNRGLSMRTAQAAGNLTWNIADAGITNGFAEGIVAAGEGQSPTDIAISSIKGAGVGMTMGVVLDRAFRGIDKVSRVLGRRIPADTAKNLDDAISYAAAQGPEGKDLSVQLRQYAQSIKNAADETGRKLTKAEADELAMSMGIDLDELAVLRVAQVEELKARKTPDEKGRAFDDPEREAIRKGIIKDADPELTPDQRAAAVAEADEAVRQQADEVAMEDAIDQGIVREPDPELDPEARARAVDEADEAVRRQAEEIEAEDARAQEASMKEAAKGADENAKAMYRQKGPAELARLRDETKSDEIKNIIDDIVIARDAAYEDFPKRLEGPEEVQAYFSKMEKDAELLASYTTEPMVLVDIPVKDIPDQSIGVKGEIDQSKLDRVREGDPYTQPPILAVSMGKDNLFIPDGVHRSTISKERGLRTIPAYVPESLAADRGYGTLPPHLRELADQIDGKTKKPAPKPEVIDRTPDGFGPAEPETPTPKEAPDGQARADRPATDTKPADDGAVSGAPGDGATPKRKPGQADPLRPAGDPGGVREADGGRYEPVETSMDDMQVFSFKSDNDTPEIVKHRAAEMKEIIAKAEKIKRSKNKPTKKSKGTKTGTAIPTRKIAPTHTAFITDMQPITGTGQVRRSGMIHVTDGGKKAVFIGDSMIARVSTRPWAGDAKWGDDGVYSVKSKKLIPSKEVLPDYDQFFADRGESVDFGNLDAQDMVRVSKKIIAITGRDQPFAVVAKNPDGTIGFGAQRSDVGSVLLDVQPGAEPIGMIHAGNLEKIARIFQRSGHTTMDIRVSQAAGSSAPDLKAGSLFQFRGRDAEITLAGLTPTREDPASFIPDEFRSADQPPAKAAKTPDPKPTEDGSNKIRHGIGNAPGDGITGYNLETIQGVPGDQRKVGPEGGPNSGVDAGLKAEKHPEWVRQPAKTKRGKISVGRVKSDPKGMKYGVRTIAEQLSKDLNLLVRQTREQSSAKNPAHYMGRPHMVRTRSSSEPNWMFHEQGHAISMLIRDANPRFLRDFSDDLVALAHWNGSMASAKTAEEGFAEFIRRSITSPGSMDSWAPGKRIWASIESANPKIADSIRDAARGFAAHMERPLDARWRSYMNDTKGRQYSVGRIGSRAMVDFVSRGFAPEIAARRVMAEVRKDAGSTMRGLRAVQKLEGKIKGTAADTAPLYQSLNHIGQMVNIAIEGPGKVPAGQPTGLRVHATKMPEELKGTYLGQTGNIVGLKQREALEAAGFKVPKDTKQHGDVVVLSDKSLADAIKPIPKEKWAEFETYAQVKATVARIKTRALEGQAFPYQTQGEGASPFDLVKLVKKADKDHPEWAGVFDDLEEIANATLLLDVMAGEISVADAIKIKNTFEHYIPLTRQGESGARTIRSGATAAPTANIRRSNGSVNPAEPLLIAMARKIDDAVNAYYWNRFAMGPIVFAETIRGMDDVPTSAKIAAERMGIPLMLDTEKVASASPEEVRKAIYNYIVDEVKAGNETFNLSPEELISFTPDDIGVVDGFDLWRKVPPKAVNVIAPNINGKRAYYQVLDDNLYRIFSEGAEGANSLARISETAFGGITQGLKTQITNSFVFAFRSLARDPLTAVMFGKDPEAMVPGFYHAVGAMAMLTGRKPDSLVSPELLSRVFRQVTPEDFAARRSKSMELLAEGLVPRGWRDMNGLNKTLSAPGIAFRVLMKPLELKMILTGQRALSASMETAPRLGAFIMAKRRGMSDEAAQLAADTVTGNFSERPQSSSAHSVYRTAGFLNPAFQIFGQTARIAMDPVPARAAAKSAVIIGNVGFWTSAVWAINRLVSSDEDRSRNAERTEQERLTHMDIKGMRIPFDYGILGGVQSYVWNQLDELDGQPGVSGDQIARKMLSEMLPHTSINPLELSPMTLKAGTEASMGVSLYRDSTIEAPYMQYLEPPERYFDSTPDLYRWVGRMTNASPVRIQYFARNGLGVQLDDAVRLLDRVDEGFSLDELASLPEIGRAFSREPIGWDSRSVREAAEIGDEYDRLKTRAKRMLEDPGVDREAVREILAVLENLQPVKDSMMKVQKLYDGAKDAAKGDRQKSIELKRQMVDVARQGLIEMQEIENRR